MDQANPLGIREIDHLEFVTSSLEGSMLELFRQLGFRQTAARGHELLMEQGRVKFLVVAPPADDSQPSIYLKEHGEGVSKISFRVQNCEEALSRAIQRGASLVSDLSLQETPEGVVKTAAIQGFGDVLNEFVERPKEVFRPGFSPLNDPLARPLQTKVTRIDHLTNNVPKGEMEHWVDFYKRIYGFVETRYFDIKGAKTGLYSKVVQLANSAVIIPINEPDREGGQSQIQEFLDRHRGPGVQHIALVTADIIETISELRQRGVRFLDIPSTYYEQIPQRNFKVQEDLAVLEQNQILVDGDPEGYLLQIFSDTYIGPLFFEYIQRKNHSGFGEGNFQALFDAIERDQERRGLL